MKILALALLLFLCACSSISDEEKSLLGYWEWKVTNEKYEESGFLHLREDRSYSYKIESKNRTERLIQEKHDYDQLWRLHNNGVCTATQWEEATIFKSAKVIQEDCLWKVWKTEAGNPYLTLNGAFLKDEIRAVRKLK
ncbi:MAG: hypothetical protein KUG81_03215 [Gammaproteobacteria bacterium]|nr:hypothetical protein [Gammaproteobacteria bacterium]